METGETFLNGKTVVYNVVHDWFKTRNPYICKLLKYKGFGNTAHDAIMDAHRKYYKDHPEELTMCHNNANAGEFGDAPHFHHCPSGEVLW